MTREESHIQMIGRAHRQPVMSKAEISLPSCDVTLYSVDQLPTYVVLYFSKGVDVSYKTEAGDFDLYVSEGAYLCLDSKRLTNLTITVGNIRKRSYIHLLSKSTAAVMYQVSAQHLQDYAYFDTNVEYEEPLFTHSGTSSKCEYSVVLASLTLARVRYL